MPIVVMKTLQKVNWLVPAIDNLLWQLINGFQLTWQDIAYSSYLNASIY